MQMTSMVMMLVACLSVTLSRVCVCVCVCVCVGIFVVVRVYSRYNNDVAFIYMRSIVASLESNYIA
jgi:hypothetical protein